MKFGRLTDLLNNFDKLDQDQIFGKIILSTPVQQYIIFLNKSDQIFRDTIDADGNTIDGTYTKGTVDSYGKGRINFRENELILDDGQIRSAGVIEQQASEGDTYFLKNSGTFFSLFEVKTDSGGFVIEAETKKADVDLLKYGNLLGLTDENKAEFSQAIRPLVVEAVRQAFFGKDISALFI